MVSFVNYDKHHFQIIGFYSLHYSHDLYINGSFIKYKLLLSNLFLYKIIKHITNLSLQIQRIIAKEINLEIRQLMGSKNDA